MNGKRYNLKRYCSESSEVGYPCPVNEENVPEDFFLQIEFNYDSTTSLLLAKTNGLTPCGNSFSTEFKGGTNEGTLEIWKSIPETVAESDYGNTCYGVENMLFYILGINCYDENLDDIVVSIDNENNKLVLEGNTPTFGTDIVTLEEDVLSISQNLFQNIKLINSNNNPFVEFIGI